MGSNGKYFCGCSGTCNKNLTFLPLLKSGMWFIMLSVAWLAGETSAIPCEEARMKCAYRVGCGMALQNYL
ncbi:hypothetical protein JTB14_017407 [Gonioctena quinquepunctata]|nr:hypothetical protein JTB14_017407 [Gonioctena quinquepunctata]